MYAYTFNITSKSDQTRLVQYFIPKNKKKKIITVYKKGSFLDGENKEEKNKCDHFKARLSQSREKIDWILIGIELK